jgi:hypothetical protein
MRKDPFELAAKAFEDRVEKLERQVALANSKASVAFVIGCVAVALALVLLFGGR